MRVLVVSSVYPGRSRPTFGLFVRERIRHVAARCELMVLAPVPWFPFNRWVRGAARAGGPLAERHDGIPVYYPRFFSLPRFGKTLDGSFYFAALLPLVAALRRRFPFDLIDAHFAYPDGVAACLLGKVFGKPVFLTLRGNEIRLAAHRLRCRQMRWALRSSRVITVSESLRGVAAMLGGDRDAVRVIPNGVDPSLFRPSDRAAARGRLGLPAERTILLGVGSLIERKGHHRMAAVVHRLVRHRPDLLYIAVGDEVRGESDRRAIEEAVRARGVSDHFRIVTQRPHAEMPVWMAAADLFCLATRWEGCCNAMIEALACGLPVVTTRVGGNAEVVSDGDNGFLVPFWDEPAFASAVLRALDWDWDHAMIRARAARRSWADVAAEVFDEFRRVAGPAVATSDAGDA